MVRLFCIILLNDLNDNLWPISRESYPKQMINLQNKFTFFQRIFLNVSCIVDDKNIITLADKKYEPILKKQLEELNEKFCRKYEYKVFNYSVEKSSAPAIALASKHINDNFKSFSDEFPIILIIPADKVFFDKGIILDVIQKASKLVEEGYIVTFGHKSQAFNKNVSYFCTKKNSQISKIEYSALKVSQFINNADEYKEENIKNLFENAGIYMFSFETFMNELEKYSKDLYSLFKSESVDFDKLPEISIEDALIKHTKKTVLLPIETDWRNINSWNDIYEACQKNQNGCSFIGKTIDLDSKNSLVYSSEKLVATLGLNDMIVVSTDDASFVCSRKNDNANRQIYKKLQKQNSKLTQVHKTVYKPWGYYIMMEKGDGFLTKCITVNPNAKLSLQKHFHRSEHWIILEGEAVIIKGDKIINLKSGESIDIDVEEVHSLQNHSLEPLKVLEIQQGEILDENDIERIEDIYGRV